jgi:hypothetical protein
MGWIGELVYGFLRAFLPFFFSGEEKTTVEHIVGLEDLDESTLTGVKDIVPPLVVALTLLLGLSGCALGGARTEYRIVLCEPGSVVEIATDRKLPVVATQADGTKVVGERNMAGTVAMPLSVYRELREAWAKQQEERGKQGK